MLAATSSSNIGLAVWTVSIATTIWIAHRLKSWLEISGEYPGWGGVKKVVRASLSDTIWDLGATAIIVISWFCIFAARTVYQDHVNFVAATQQLRAKVDELQIKGPYEKSFIGSFAFTNTLGAFAGLTRDPRYQPNPSSECQIKITTPRTENREAAMGLRSIASTVGCYVQQEPYDPDIDPETSKEIQQSLPGFVVIHAAKGNDRADGFVVGMGNTFHVRRVYDLPPDSPKNLVWLQIGPGSIWRIY
jgi:hypothetical protein